MKWRGIFILLKHDPSGRFDKPKKVENGILFPSIDGIPHLATMRKMEKIIVISHLPTCVIFVTFFILPWKSAFDLPSSSDGVHCVMEFIELNGSRQIVPEMVWLYPI